MTAAMPDLTIRRALRPGDPAAIEALHAEVYGREYGLGRAFSDSVARSVAAAADTGWPDAHGAVWLIDGERAGELAGALALTREQPPALGTVHWFVLAPSLRGHGLGRSMLAELLDTAREQRMQRLQLETFSALTAAAHLYRGVGFEVVWSAEFEDWGPPITVQRYELAL